MIVTIGMIVAPSPVALLIAGVEPVEVAVLAMIVCQPAAIGGVFVGVPTMVVFVGFIVIAMLVAVVVIVMVLRHARYRQRDGSEQGKGSEGLA